MADRDGLEVHWDNDWPIVFPLLLLRMGDHQSRFLLARHPPNLPEMFPMKESNFLRFGNIFFHSAVYFQSRLPSQRSKRFLGIGRKLRLGVPKVHRIGAVRLTGRDDPLSPPRSLAKREQSSRTSGSRPTELLLILLI